MDVALESATARGFGTALRAEHMLFRGRRAKNEHGEPSPGPARRGRVVVRQVVARDCTGTRGAASGDTDRVGIEDSRGVFCIMYVRELIFDRIDVS